MGDQKTRFISANETLTLFVLAQKNPLPTVQIPAGLFASGTDVVIARVYLYLHIRHSLRRDSASSWESEFPLQISLVIVGLQAHVVWELLLRAVPHLGGYLSRAQLASQITLMLSAHYHGALSFFSHGGRSFRRESLGHFRVGGRGMGNFPSIVFSILCPQKDFPFFLRIPHGVSFSYKVTPSLPCPFHSWMLILVWLPFLVAFVSACYLICPSSGALHFWTLIHLVAFCSWLRFQLWSGWSGWTAGGLH